MFVNRVIPLYKQYRYQLKLSFYSLPLLIHWIVPVTFEKDTVLINIAKRSMVLFFMYLSGTLIIYIIGIFLLAVIPHSFHDLVSPLQFFIQTVLTAIYSGLSLFYSYEVFQGNNDIDPIYEKFSDRMEEVLSK